MDCLAQWSHGREETCTLFLELVEYFISVAGAQLGPRTYSGRRRMSLHQVQVPRVIGSMFGCSWNCLDALGASKIMTAV